MRLLIVDDQRAVVDGLLRQDWGSIGISQVTGVCSAAEARRVLAEYVVDVMLCDIEMPVENGLSLVKWMRDQNIMAKVIFLTAHAEFSYAQKSVSLGAFDYVVQPAPYAEIRRAVERATESVQEEKHQTYLRKYGHITGWKSKQQVADALKEYLQSGESSKLAPYIRTGDLPGETHSVYLVYMQIQRWFSFEKWSENLLVMMMDNAISEVFSRSGQKFLVTLMGQEQFALLLWDGQSGQERINHRLSFLHNVCRQQLKCTLALYPKGPLQFFDLAEVWNDLIQTHKNNGQLRTGVVGQVKKQDAPVHRDVQKSTEQWWRDVLTADDKNARDMLELRPEMKGAGGGLTVIQNEFLNAIHQLSGNGDEFWRKVLVDNYSYEIYHHATESKENFIKLVELAKQRFSGKELERTDRIVETVIKYINDNLDKDIHRSDLADFVYLNPDYLNRLFKKQTGKTLKEFVIEYKMQEAKKMLQLTRLPVSIIAAKVGYDNFSHFSYAYKKVIGQSPMETRNAGK